MAEPIGFAASVLTLNHCVWKLISFANAFKNAPETLLRYGMVLKSIQTSAALVAHLSDEFDFIRTISVLEGDQNVNLIDLYGKNVEGLIEDIQHLIRRFEDAQSPAVKRASKGFLWKLKVYIKRTSATLDLIYNDEHIKALIEAAKSIESSQHMALTVLVIHNQANRENLQGALDKLSEAMAAQSDAFDKMQEINRCNETPVVYILKKPEKPQNTPGSTGPREEVRLPERQSRPSQQQNAHGGESDAQSYNSIPRTLDSTTNGISSQNSSNTAGEENFVIVRNDGGIEFVSKSSDNEKAGSSNEPLYSELQTADVRAPSRLHYDLVNEVGSEGYHFSETEDFETQTSTGYLTPGSTTTVLDSVEMQVEKNAMLFLDPTVSLAICKSSDTGGYRFCAKTLFVQDDGSPNLILREPCITSTECQHITLHTRDVAWDKQELPCSLEVLLREGMTSTSCVNGQVQERLTLIVVQIGRNRSVRTLVISKEGRRKDYSISTPLDAFGIPCIDGSDEEGAEGPAESIESADTVPDSSADLETSVNIGESTVDGAKQRVNFGIGNFSRVPCLFCQKNALRPKRDSGGGLTMLLYHNNSFGYSCDRCKEKTWVSASRFGLPGVGGA